MVQLKPWDIKCWVSKWYTCDHFQGLIFEQIFIFIPSSKNSPRKNLSDFWQYFWPTWPKWLSLQHWSKQCCLVMTCQGMPWAQQRCTLLSFALHCTAWERARQHAVCGHTDSLQGFLFISVSCAKPANFSNAYLFSILN